MPTAANMRGGQAKGQWSYSRKDSSTPVSGKEFNYVLQITDADSALLKRYQNVLEQGAVSYAETAYNYFFDNPDIADALYAFERNGGNIGQFVRAQLQHMLGLLNGSVDQSSTLLSEEMGRSLHKHGVKPIWILGSYRLFLDHLQKQISSDSQVAKQDKKRLEAALIKIIFRDAAITCETYWRTSIGKLTKQRDELGIEQGLADQLLCSIPQLLWTVDVENNHISYANPGTQKFCTEGMDAPIPCFSRIDGSERERVLIAWQKVIDGESAQLVVKLAPETDQKYWYRMAFYPTTNRRGRVLCVHCLMEDVTELYSDQKRLEQIAKAPSSEQQLRYSGQLHGALERGEFELYYQPKIDMQTGQLSGAEALIRWQHPQQGMVLPKQFIPVAEQLGMITSITDWVLERALQESQTWKTDGKVIPVSVNMTAQLFHSPDLLDRVHRALQEVGVEGNQLEIEITEDALMVDLELGANTLSGLSDLGVEVAIDDFGTGYSSLAYLKGLPISILKIDQSFLQGLEVGSQNTAIVRSIIELGHNLGCKVVAEGVEDQSVLNQLQQLGCDSVQGFHISKPLPGATFANWISLSQH